MTKKQMVEPLLNNQMKIIKTKVMGHIYHLLAPSRHLPLQTMKYVGTECKGG